MDEQSRFDADHPLEKATAANSGDNRQVVDNTGFPEESVGQPDRSEPADMEVAQEMSPTLPRHTVKGSEDESDRPRAEDDGLRGQGLGWTGLVLSILAFFIYPVFFGIAGAVLGFLGYRQGAQTLGIWSMVLGALAVLGALLFSPYFVR